LTIAEGSSREYQAALDFLFPRTQNYRVGLERTQALLDALGRPDWVFPVIHIGGTNGKGSVSTLVAETLEAAGWRTGLYTSPHLISFRERYRVDGVPITEQAVASWVEFLKPTIVKQDATFFEVGTAIAFADFAARGVEIAVVEVGLGGRLDSTNVVQPVVSALTHVALDHQKYLGNTLEEIAAEKAWIAKPGAPFVVGEPRADLIEVLRREGGKSVRSLDPGAQLDMRVVPPGARYDGVLGLAGTHQKRNAAVARAVLDALPERYRPGDADVRSAFGGARVPGRLDRHGRWLFDVAHNPDGMRALVRALRELDIPRPIHALVSILGDKAWPEMLVMLDEVIDRGVLTVAPSADTRRWDMEWLRRWLKEPDRPAAKAAWQLIPDFQEALNTVQQGGGTILVTGSFHTVGDVMAELGLGDV
jgi:dihydrofolate synthase/folylpolyglutamate synthase